jgi:hypothetical protein
MLLLFCLNCFMKIEALRIYYNYVEANIARSVLEEEGIRAFLGDENMTTLMPMAGEGQGIKLIVAEEDREKANEILARMNNNNDN